MKSEQKLLTYIGFYESPYFCRWECWLGNKGLIGWMSLEMVNQMGRRKASEFFTMGLSRVIFGG